VSRVWPFRHIALKITAVAFAIALWMTVSGEETVERGLRVPLQLQQFPAGLELQGEVPANVDVRVRGTAGTLGRLAPGDMVAVLDLRGARVGRRLFTVTPEQVRTPFGVQVMQVTPSTVAMAFEQSATREVPVVPDIDGRPAPGYVIGPPASDPAKVEVVGPASAVARVTEALTEPVSVAGAHEAVKERVSVGLLDPVVRLKDARTATVTIPITPAPLERAVRDRPVHLRNLGSQLVAAAQPSAVTVAVRASRDALSRVQPDDITAYVDLAGLGAGEYTLNVHAMSARDAGVTRVEPETVHVRVSRARN
jgi:YbbR domain-containing protein